MPKYIPKEPLVAEIERRLEELYKLLPDASKVENRILTIPEAYNTGKRVALESFKDYVDTLEMKEVDLDEEIKSYFKGFGMFPSVGIDDCIDIAKHFFELGMQVSNKAQKEE